MRVRLCANEFVPGILPARTALSQVTGEQRANDFCRPLVLIEECGTANNQATCWWCPGAASNNCAASSLWRVPPRSPVPLTPKAYFSDCPTELLCCEHCPFLPASGRLIRFGGERTASFVDPLLALGHLFQALPGSSHGSILGGQCNPAIGRRGAMHLLHRIRIGKLGRLGETLAGERLAANGFTDVEDLNRLRVNYPFGDLLATSRLLKKSRRSRRLHGHGR